MLKTAKEIFDYLNENLPTDCIKLLIQPSFSSTVDDYIQQLSAISELAPFMALQSQISHLIPLDPERRQYTRDVYSFLNNKKELKGKIPKPQMNETFTSYREKLEKIEELQTPEYKNLDALVPVAEYQKTSSAWDNRESELKEFTQKMSSGKVLLVQDRNGNIHERSLQGMLHGASQPIYKRLHDYSLALTLGKMVDEALEKNAKALSSLQDTVITAVTDNLQLLNNNVGMFYDGLIETFKEIKPVNENNLTVLKTIAAEISAEFDRAGSAQIKAIDKALLKKYHPHFNKRNGLEIKLFNSGADKPGILVTTSNGGGCHKVIASKNAEYYAEQEIDYAILNESEVAQVDPLQQIMGIPHTDIYPVISQQCSKNNLRKYFREIDEIFNMEFIPSYEFAQVRTVARSCDKRFKVGTVLSTQHYAEDLRLAPKDSNVIFQVCDYGHFGKLEPIANAAADLVSKTNKKYHVQFYVPSQTCLQKVNAVPDAQLELFIPSLYPTKIQSKAETKMHFESLIKKQDLFPSNEKDIYRCAIVMGGQGCGDLIKEYIDKIFAGLESNKLNLNEKLEIIVACGKNEAVVDELNKTYKDRIASLPNKRNIKIKFCGPIDNPELIAYNKNAVLITKPGGGTIAECIENQIETLVHYDENFHWEYGNASEVKTQEVGKILEANDKDIDVLEEIKMATQRRKKRLATQDDLEEYFNREIEILNEALRQRKRDNKENFLQDGSMNAFFYGEDIQQMNAHLKNVIVSLKRLKNQFPKSTVALKELSDLQDMQRTFINVSGPKNMKEHMKSVDSFLNTYGKTSPIVHVVKQHSRNHLTKKVQGNI